LPVRSTRISSPQLSDLQQHLTRVDWNQLGTDKTASLIMAAGIVGAHYESVMNSKVYSRGSVWFSRLVQTVFNAQDVRVRSIADFEAAARTLDDVAFKDVRKQTTVRQIPKPVFN